MILAIWPMISIIPQEVHGEKSHFLRTFGTYIFERAANDSHTEIPTTGRRNGYYPDFDVIIGGRLHPIVNLSI